ncbi:MAG: DNA-directed RNA polymerase subunit H [Candidatus Micrarchaeia archaeon]
MAKTKVKKPKISNFENEPIVHKLIPKHEIVKEEDEKKLLESLNATKEQLPKIKIDDPAIRHLNPKKGDIIRIHREEKHAKNIYYRVVV